MSVRAPDDGFMSHCHRWRSDMQLKKIHIASGYHFLSSLLKININTKILISLENLGIKTAVKSECCFHLHHRQSLAQSFISLTTRFFVGMIANNNLNVCIITRGIFLHSCKISIDARTDTGRYYHTLTPACTRTAHEENVKIVRVPVDSQIRR